MAVQSIQIQIIDTHINSNTTNSLETLSKDNDNIRYQEGHLKINIVYNM